MLQPGDEPLELRQKTLVLGVVLSQTRKAILFHQLLLAKEVHAREFDQPGQQFILLYSLSWVSA